MRKVSFNALRTFPWQTEWSVAARRREFNFLFSVLFPLFCFNIFRAASVTTIVVAVTAVAAAAAAACNNCYQFPPGALRHIPPLWSATLNAISRCILCHCRRMDFLPIPPPSSFRHLPYLERQVSWDYTFYMLLQFSSNYLNGWQCLISRIQYSFYLQN